MSPSSLAWHKFTVVLLAFVTAGVLFPQTQTTGEQAPAAQPAPKPSFFAGTVTEIDQDHVTVSRSVVGRAPEHRSFLIKPDTKMNRSAVKVKSRVTVRYLHMPEGDVALEIQMRPPAHGAKPS